MVYNVHWTLSTIAVQGLRAYIGHLDQSERIGYFAAMQLKYGHHMVRAMDYSLQEFVGSGYR